MGGDVMSFVAWNKARINFLDNKFTSAFIKNNILDKMANLTPRNPHGTMFNPIFTKLVKKKKNIPGVVQYQGQNKPVSESANTSSKSQIIQHLKSTCLNDG